MPEISLEIPGVPIAKKRPRFVRRGKFVGTYNCQETEEGRFMWEVRRQLDLNYPTIPLPIPKNTPIELHVFCWMPIPTSMSKKQRIVMEISLNPRETAHIKVKDIDNFLKFVMDCLSGIVWHDDRQVYRVVAMKNYHTMPGTTIRVMW